jgi:hypothetical protein
MPAMRWVRATPRVLAGAAAAAILAFAPSADAGDPAAARDQLKMGWELSQADKCDEAIPHLEESLRLDVKSITLINLANCEEKVGHLGDALGHWVDARARAQAEGNVAIEAEAEKRAKLLEPRLAHLTISLAKGAAAGAEVSRDGTVLGGVSLGVAASVGPGTHVVVVKAKGRKDARFEVAVNEGEAKAIEVATGDPDGSGGAASASAGAPQEDTSSGTSPLVWAGFGVGAAGLAVGAITGLMAISKANACPNHVCPNQNDLDGVSSGRTLGTISTIGFVVAGAGAAVGVLGLTVFRAKGHPEGATAAKAALYIAPASAGLAGTF